MSIPEDPKEILKSLAEDYRDSFEKIEKLAQQDDPEEIFANLLAVEGRLLGEMRHLQMEIIGEEGEGLKEKMLEFFRMADRVKIVLEFQRDTALDMARRALSEE
jgi:hypothetical protein